MTALAKLKTPSVENDANPEEVLIHVRFHRDGEVSSIDGCPERVSPRDWFNRLSAMASQHYEVFAGGRGLFRLPRGLFEAMLAC